MKVSFTSAVSIAAFLACVGLGLSQVQAQNVAFFGTGARADPDFIARLEADGYTVTSHSPSSENPGEAQSIAAANDVVIISETIGSSSVSQGGVFHLQESTTPIVSYEAYHWDEAKWSGANADGSEFGNTGRDDRPAYPLASMSDLQDTIYIQDAASPYAAGLSGDVQVYTGPFSVSYNMLGGDSEAKVIATLDAAATVPCLFVYEAGDMLYDGSTAAGTRVGLYFGQGGAGVGSDLQYDLLTEDGLALFDAAVATAIPEPGTLGLLVLSGVALLRRRRKA